jgi:Hsp90 protein
MGDNRAMEYMRGRRIMEINPDSPVIRVLKAKLDSAARAEAEAMVGILHETALLTSGFQVDSPKEYAAMCVHRASAAVLCWGGCILGWLYTSRVLGAMCVRPGALCLGGGPMLEWYTTRVRGGHAAWCGSCWLLDCRKRAS